MSFFKITATSKLISRNLVRQALCKTRNFSQENYFCGIPNVREPKDALLTHYSNLSIPKNKVFATYVWIDNSGIIMRSKDRVLEHFPCDLCSVPKWSFDGSSTGQATTENSDIQLIPCALYKDPFVIGKHVIVLCETYHSDGGPTSNNHRAQCAKVLSGISESEPWFGIEQEYTMFDYDMWPLGWPKARGIPVIKSKFSYCGVGAHVVGRYISQCHARACLHSGMDYSGSNAEVMKGSWEFQVGATCGIKAADDLWMGRYLLNRIAENFDVIISYDPKPMGKYFPGIGCHHNFSTKKMRDKEGLTEIERVCKILCDRHENLMKSYGLGDGQQNKKRLTGNFETASFDKCSWGVADRTASVRLQTRTVSERKGFLEDRRPAGDCDPYRVCALLAETV